MQPAAPNTDPARCIKCGFCMSICPVYTTDHIESHVARGRNMLIKMADNDEAEKDSTYKDCMSFCLLCGRCETVCPAAISSVDIALQSRRELCATHGLPLAQRLVYRGLLNRRPTMASVLRLVSLLPGFSSKDGTPLRHLPDIASSSLSGLAIPKLSRPFLSKRISAASRPSRAPAREEKVAFFPGCSFEFFFAGQGEAIVSRLAAWGFEVSCPPELTCCGLAVENAGDVAVARAMAKRNISVLADYDFVITACASCGSTLKQYGKWFAGDEQWEQRARGVSDRTRDLSEFVRGQQCEVASQRSERVTFHDPCHLRWRQGIWQEPRALLRSVEGLELVEMEGADACCGLGGAFGLQHRDISLAMQRRKMDNIAKTGVQTVVTSCPGCMVQLMDGARRHCLDIAVRHISDFL